MKSVFYFMAAFLALAFLFGGVLGQNAMDTSGAATSVVTQNEQPAPEYASQQLQGNNSDIITVYPYEKKP